MSDPIEYQIKGIEILEFSVTEQKDKLNADLTYGFGFTLDHSLDIETKTISVTCSLKISDAADSIQFASLKAACIYELTDFLSYVKTAPVKISFPESFYRASIPLRYLRLGVLLFLILRVLFFIMQFYPSLTFPNFSQWQGMNRNNLK
ncbi:MAG: hypothetical protein IPP61_20510 [Cytophagaceae bacterium]|nr:hypothetical protein [Cytophagaceae bacterium]